MENGSSLHSTDGKCWIFGARIPCGLEQPSIECKTCRLCLSVTRLLQSAWLSCSTSANVSNSLFNGIIKFISERKSMHTAPYIHIHILHAKKICSILCVQYYCIHYVINDLVVWNLIHAYNNTAYNNTKNWKLHWIVKSKYIISCLPKGGYDWNKSCRSYNFAFWWAAAIVVSGFHVYGCF